MRYKKHNDAHIKDVLASYLGENKKLSDKYIQNRIETIWNAKMGKMINSYTSKLSYSKGVLVVYLSAAALKSEMLMEKDNVISLLNTELKNESIKKLIIK